jgi:hypothetical protein
MSESVESYGDEEPSINTVVKLIRTLQHSTDRDAVIDAIEDLRTQARGNGMLGLNQFVPEQINWLFCFMHLLSQYRNCQNAVPIGIGILFLILSICFPDL